MLLTAAQEVNQPKKSMRLQSVDTMRGITMFFVMGMADTLSHIDEVCSWPFFQWLAAQMDHAEWNGFNIRDLFFPTFIFIAGIVFPFSSASRLRKGGTKKDLYIHVFKRAFKLILLGLVYNGILQNFWHARYASVNGRIGLAWMTAALIFMLTTRNRTRIMWAGGILIGYWLLLRFVPAPDFPGAALYSAEGSITCYIDRLLIPQQHLYNALYDPEGLLGSIPAGAACLIGMVTGDFIKNQEDNITPTRKCIYLTACGIGSICLGYIWNFVFPINKKLYTSSFACVVVGIGLILFAALYYIIDVRGINKWSVFFRVIGCNSLAIYIGRKVVDFTYSSKFLFGSLISLFPANWYTFLVELGALVLCWLVLYFLYKKKVYIKI